MIPGVLGHVGREAANIVGLRSRHKIKGLPNWLDEDFLATVLQGGEHKKPKVTITNYIPMIAFFPNDNNQYYIFRVEVDYKEHGTGSHKTTLLVKTPHHKSKGLIGNIVSAVASLADDIFGREIRVYNELLPRLNAKLGFDFNPQCYYCPSHIKAFITQDLKQKGYFMCDMRNQLDFYQCQLAISNLAKFHAASVAFYNEDPNFILSIGKELKYVDGGLFTSLFRACLQTCAKAVVATVAGIEACALGSEFLLKRSEHLFENLARLSRPKERGLNVLNHGDFWMHNLMFKNDKSGKPKSVKFTNFETTRYSSPVLDLLYFFWTSANQTVRKTKLRELFFGTYLRTLNSTLEELGCRERMSEMEFQEDLKNSIDWAVMAILYVLPTALGDGQNAVDADEVSEEEFERRASEETAVTAYTDESDQVVVSTTVEYFYTWSVSLDEESETSATTEFSTSGSTDNTFTTESTDGTSTTTTTYYTYTVESGTEQ